MDNDLIKILMFLILLSFIQIPVFAQPQWSNNQNFTPSTYSPSTLSEFNVTWDNEIDTVLIEINYTDSFDNYTMTNDTYEDEIYNYSLVLPAGTFQWKSYANDTTGAWNSTDTWTVTINRAPTEINLTLNGNKSNMSCEQYDNVTFVTQINVTGLNISLTSNYPDINETNSTIINKTVNLTESEGLCCVTALYSGNLNYSESSSTTYFFDTQGPQYSDRNHTEPTYLLNKTYYFNITWSDATLNQTWFEFDYNNGTVLNYTNEIQNSDNIFWINLTGLYVGPNYTYKWYANDSLGITNNTSEINYTISPGSVLEIIGETSVTYQTTIIITCWSSDNQIDNSKFALYRILTGSSSIDNIKVNNTSYSWSDIQTSLGVGTWIYYCNITDSSLIGNYSNTTSHNLTVNPQETTDTGTPGTTTTTTPPSGSISIQGLTSRLTVNAGESKSTTFSIKNTYDISFYVNISISGISDTWYTLDKKTSVRVFGDSSEAITLTFNIPEDAEAKDYTVIVTVKGGTNPQSSFTLTVNPPVEEEELITTEQPETNVTTNETASPTGLFPFDLLDLRYVVLIVGAISCILVFIFRNKITGALLIHYQPKPTKEKEIKVKPEEKIQYGEYMKTIKKKPEEKSKIRFPFSGLKLKLTLIKEKIKKRKEKNKLK